MSARGNSSVNGCITVVSIGKEMMSVARIRKSGNMSRATSEDDLINVLLLDSGILEHVLEVYDGVLKLDDR